MLLNTVFSLPFLQNYTYSQFIHLPSTIDIKTGSAFNPMFSLDGMKIQMAERLRDSWLYEKGHVSTAIRKLTIKRFL